MPELQDVLDWEKRNENLQCVKMSRVSEVNAKRFNDAMSILGKICYTRITSF